MKCLICSIVYTLVCFYFKLRIPIFRITFVDLFALHLMALECVPSVATAAITSSCSSSQLLPIPSTSSKYGTPHHTTLDSCILKIYLPLFLTSLVHREIPRLRETQSLFGEDEEGTSIGFNWNGFFSLSLFCWLFYTRPASHVTKRMGLFAMINARPNIICVRIPSVRALQWPWPKGGFTRFN